MASSFHLGLPFQQREQEDGVVGHGGVGGGEQSVVRALSETNGQPSPDDGDVSDACKGEEDHDGAGGGEDKKKHQARASLGCHCQTSRQLLRKNESFWVQSELQIPGAEVWG